MKPTATLRVIVVIAILGGALVASPGSTSDRFRAGVVAYESGLYETAARIWQRLARETGDSAAQYNLGLMHEQGRGVEQSYRVAAHYYLKAAQQGYAAAQYNLAGLYHRGQGVPHNDREAVFWWSKAAQQGYNPAQYVLGVLLLQGKLVPENREYGVRWLKLAARDGHQESAALLARIQNARLHSIDLSPPGSAPTDLVGQVGNIDWILRRKPSNFTVELYHANSAREAAAFISRFGIREVATFYQDTRGQFVVIGGAYETKEYAEDAIAHLTRDLRDLGPVVRTFASVQDEIERRQRNDS